MGLFDKSLLKPEGSVVSGLATAGSVYALYQLNVGPVSMAHQTDANNSVLETSRKKAAWESFILVSAVTLLTKDTGVGILGYSSIVAMEATYRHAIMADAKTGQMQAPAKSAYQPAENVVPFAQQGQTG
jgi:hypothetical protein